MKAWQKYSDYCFSGEWHIHTNYTDGQNSVAEYAEAASRLGIPLLAFTEHIRKQRNYSFEHFMQDIEQARARHPDLIILSGCEAKVLPDGSLDCETDLLKSLDLVLFAFHSFPEDKNLYLSALEQVIQSDLCDVWAHPGLFLKRHPKIFLSPQELKHILMLMARHHVVMEINKKYDLPGRDWISLYKELHAGCVLRGSDVHRVEDLAVCSDPYS